jgi:predicted TIM-barrel fold metal-dependent hydrolase
MTSPLTASAGRPYVVVSTDAHAGPAPEKYLRDYCPRQYLALFDDFCAQARVVADRSNEQLRAALGSGEPRTLRQFGAEALSQCVECEGHHDPHARLADMDESGVAAEVVFAGGQNFEQLPFMGKGWDAGPPGMETELRTVAGTIWNRWLADYVSVGPERLVGVLQTSIWDLDNAVREIRWGAEHGLRVVNLPAPRRDFPSYTDRMYDPFWAACSDVGAALVTHSGGGDEPLGMDSPRGRILMISENNWLGNRGLAQLVFGGVFHRFPSLKYVLTEQRVNFAPDLIRHLDSAYYGALCGESTEPGVIPSSPFVLAGPDVSSDANSEDALPLRPSEYFHRNCYLSGSFLARFEVELRSEVGVKNLMWGTDYPHIEGTWPHTRESIRHTFHDVPEAEARLILGETATEVYGFDAGALRAVADRIGPTPEEVATPLAQSELPRGRSGAFRLSGSYA